MPAAVSSTAAGARAAASTSQRSCWRSTPLARRKRTSSEPAATTMVRAVAGEVVPYTAWSGPARAATANGLRTACSGESRSTPGTPPTHDSRNASGRAAATQAHQRQRADGSDPVGVSSRMKPMQPSPGTKVAEASTPRWAAAGSAPGRARSP